MAAIALIKFTQGPNTDIAGRAVVGTPYGVDGSVVVSNDDPTDIHHWKVYLVSAPPGSALELATQGDWTLLNEGVSNTPTASFNPDIAGSYRILLQVWDVANNLNQDIRNFIILDDGDFILPPFQKLPDPLPLPNPQDPSDVQKPNEMNVGGQPYGWMGNTSYQLHHQLIKHVATLVPSPGAGDTSKIYVVTGAGSVAFSFLVDANIDAAAAIDVSKLAPGTNGYVLTTSGGVPVWAAPSGGGLTPPSGAGDIAKLAFADAAGTDLDYADGVKVKNAGTTQNGLEFGTASIENESDDLVFNVATGQAHILQENTTEFARFDLGSGGSTPRLLFANDGAVVLPGDGYVLFGDGTAPSTGAIRVGGAFTTGSPVIIPVMVAYKNSNDRNIISYIAPEGPPSSLAFGDFSEPTQILGTSVGIQTGYFGVNSSGEIRFAASSNATGLHLLASGLVKIVGGSTDRVLEFDASQDAIVRCAAWTAGIHPGDNLTILAGEAFGSGQPGGQLRLASGPGSTPGTNDGDLEFYVGGTSGTKVLVFDVDTVAPTDGQVLTWSATNAAAEWVTPGGGSGDVVGPASATDNAVARFDTTTGKLIQDSVFLVDDSGNVTGAGTYNGETVANLIHDNVAGEIAAVTEKASPVSADLVLIEDSADSNNKKRVQVGNLPGGGSGDVVGPASATDNAVARFDTTTGKLIQDSVFLVDDSGNVTGAGTYNGETVANLIHDNVAGEIAAVTEKATPVSADVLLIEDSADSNNKKRIQIGNLPASSGDVVGPGSATDNAVARFDTTTGKLIQDSVFLIDDSGNVTGAGTYNGETVANLIHDNVAGEIIAVTEKATPVSGDVLLIEDSADSNNKKRVQVGNLPTGGAGSDTTAIHDDTAAEISAITEKATPVSADLLLIEDSADSNNKKRVQVGNLPSSSGDVVGPASATDNAVARFDTTTGKLIQDSVFLVDDSGNVTGAGTYNGETVANLIHDNVAGEITAVTLKATPVSGDVLLIEDSADSNNKKRITVGSLPSSSGDVVGPASATDNAVARFDTTTGKLIQDSVFLVDDSGNVTGAGTYNGETVANLIHDNVAGEITAVTEKATPVSADVLLIEDSADSNNKKRVQVGNLPTGGAGSDTTAIHDDTAGEISAVTEKATPVSADLLLIEDSADSNNKKRVQVGNLPSSSGDVVGPASATDNAVARFDTTTGKLIQDSVFLVDDSGNVTGAGTYNGETVANLLHDNVAGEIAAVTEKATPVSADLVLIEDSADSNNKKRVQVGNLPGGGSGDVVGPASATDNAIARFDTTTGKLIQDSVFLVDDSGNVTGAGTYNGETVANLIHDNVAGEISAVTLKATPVSADLLLIEDSADSNNKKRITVGSLPSSSGDVVGPASATDNAVARFDTTTGKLIQDSVFLVDDSGNVTGAGTYNGETVANLIHDNVAGEITAVTLKATPVSADVLLIEDSADSNNKKRITVGSLPSSSGDVVGPASATDNAVARFDTTTGKLIQDSVFLVDDSGNVTGAGTYNGETVANLIHDNVAGEITAVTEKATPVSADVLLIEDSADSNNKKRVQIGNLPTGSDPDAIHDNVASEISAVTEKTTPVSADLILIEDSADSNNKKRVQIGNLPYSSGDVVGPASATDNAVARFDTTTGKLIQDSVFLVDDSGNVTGAGTYNGETVANLIHDNVAGEITAVSLKATPVSGDVLLIEDSADSNNKKRITVGSLPSSSGDVVGPASATDNAVARYDTTTGKLIQDSVFLVDDSGNVTGAGTYNGETVANLIHDNVAGEITAVTEKATPISADVLLIEDSADSNNKKRVQIGNLPTGGAGSDTTAIHDDTAGEIAAVTEKATPVSADLILIEDSADSNNKKRVQIGNLPGGGSGDVVGPASATDNAVARFDTTTGKLIQDSVFLVDDSGNVTGAGTYNGETVANLIHDNVAGEISAVTLKATPVSADVILIEDSADSNNKKRITVGSLPSSSGDVVGPASATDNAVARFDTTTGKLIQDSVFLVDDSGNVTGAGTYNGETVANLIHDNVAGEISAVTEKATPVSADVLLIEDSADSNNKKRVQVGNLPGGGAGSDTTAIHDDTAGEISAITEKATPVSADLILIEDSADSNNKKRVQVGNLPSSSGDVVGPASATDNAVARFDTTTGKLIQDSVFLVDDSGNVTGAGTYNGETVANLIHDNVAGEITAVTLKATPVSADVLLIEDSADSNNKKRITVGSLPSSSGDVVGPSSATDNAVARFDTTTGKLIQDSVFLVDDSGNVTGAGTYNGETVANLIHDNVASEISAITEKATPVSADLLLIEDSADSNNKKRVQVGNLPGGGSGDVVGPASATDNAVARFDTTTGKLIQDSVFLVDDSGNVTGAGTYNGETVANLIHDNVAGEITAVTEKATPVSADVLLIEDSADSNNKKRVQVGNLPGGGAGSDTTAIHDDTAAEISAITEKATPVSADLLLIEDSADSNNKKRVQVGNLPSGGSTVTFISPSQITSDQNNYAPTDWSTANAVRLSSDASRNITGLNGSASVVKKILINVGSYNIVLQHENSSSTAANRLIVSGGSDLTVQPNDAVTVLYDPVTTRWRVV
jgi:hypothetical protein